MNKKPNLGFLIVGIGLILAAVFIFIRNERYKSSSLFVDNQRLVVQGNHDASRNWTNDSTPPAAEPAKEWMHFGKIDLLAEDVSFDFVPECGEPTLISIPPIQIAAWHPEVFEKGEFGIGKNLAVAWEHLGYEGLWIHSGWDFWQEQSPATALQYYLETDALNQVQNLKTIQSRLDDCLRGSQVWVGQEQISLNGKVAAAVRVPPYAVEELSKHTMDLVPFLAQKYPGAGFEDISEEALLLFFCGRAALDEPTNADADYWTQARYVIALMPEETIQGSTSN